MTEHSQSHQHDHQHDEAAAVGDPKHRPRKQEQEDATTDITEVAPGILRSQLPISMPGLGHVNCYILEDERGIAVVDPGLPGPESWESLVDRLARANYKVADVHTVVVTHSHPDHYGGALRLKYETGADIVSHEAFTTIWHTDDMTDDEDSSTLEIRTAEDQFEAMQRYFDRPSPWGGRRSSPSPEFMERMRTAGKDTGGEFAIPGPTIPLVDGQTVKLARREWVAMHTPGHTYDHLCLYDPEFGVVITGDHVLPTITPHISGMTPQADPLAEFFASLGRMEDIENVSVALPAHGHPFTDLGGRARHIIEHHEDRLDIVRDAWDRFPNGTVNDFMKVLFRERSWGDMAESETYAHLEHLRELGEVARTNVDGVATYAPTA